MKFHKLLPFPLLIVGGTNAALARTVDVLHFEDRFVTDVPMATNPRMARAGTAVATSLRSHFQNSVQEQLDTKTMPSPASVGKPPLDASRLEIPYLANSPISVACDRVFYAPTWWLPPAAETRRAAYFDTVARIACDYGLPIRLLDAVIAQESGYNSRAMSTAGAMGMMQIMPATARELGLERPFDPIANMRAGARYLRQQLDRFGRVDLALAAYNAGPERRSLQRGTIPRIPETVNYVRAVTTNWARLAELSSRTPPSFQRARAATMAVNQSPYRSVELTSYD